MTPVFQSIQRRLLPRFSFMVVLLASAVLGGCQRACVVPVSPKASVSVPIRPLPSKPPVDSIAHLQLRTNETELAALTRLETELLLLERTVRDAERASQHLRYQFAYDALRLDLTRIRNGIREYRAGELSQPREIEPLAGEYRR